MTKEEAIEILQKYLFDDEECIAQDMKDYNEALKMAIEALSADRPQGVGRYENAMQKLREMPKYLNGVKAKQIKKISADVVQGEWIWCGDKGDSRFMCSVCKSKENVPTCMGEPTIWDYCPNCGARMKGGNSE